MFNYWKKVDTLNQVNRLLLAGVFLCFLIILGLLHALACMPDKVEFWLAPSMAANGGLIKGNDVPAEYVHGFATALIPALNTWSKSGKEEFANNIRDFHYYFTPRHEQLMKNTLKAYGDAQLFNRTQIASLYRFLEPGDIKPLGQGSWEVHLQLRITQRVSNQSTMVIADKVVDYHLRVVKVSISKLQNPFQLALDGYTKPEHLVIDLLSQDLKGEKNEASI